MEVLSPFYLFCPAGETPKDLSFIVGDKLTILKPDIAMYWYVAQNDRGQRGIIPFNLVEVRKGYENCSCITLSVKSILLSLQLSFSVCFIHSS